MTTAKVVLITGVKAELRNMFVTGAPENMRVISVDLETTAEEEISQQLQDADFLVIHQAGRRVPDRLIQGAQKLRHIHTPAQGLDHVPLVAAKRMGTTVSNGGGSNAIAVAEHTILLMLATLKQLPVCIETVRSGKSGLEIDLASLHQINRKKVGIIGLGNIGRRVAKMLSGFETEIVFYDTADIPQSVVSELRVSRVSLETLLSTSDIVTLLVPLLESTKGMIGWQQLTRIKPSAILINTSRGGVVDEAALIRALKEKVIAGAGLDVFASEPPSQDNPLLHMVNVVTTPHIAGHNWETWLLLIKDTWDNLARILEGKEPRNLIK